MFAGFSIMGGGGGEPIDIWQIHHDGVMIDQGTFELNWLMFIFDTHKGY